MSKLGSDSDLFPESVMPSVDRLSMMRTEARLLGKKGPLLSCNLWCALGRIYLLQNKLALAELCAHEAFITSELDVETYCLRAEILERQGNWEAATNGYQLSLQTQETVPALLGLAQCQSKVMTDHPRLHLALHAAIRATELDPTNVVALGMAADLAKSLNMDGNAEHYYTKALELEETDPIMPWQTAIDLIICSLI